MSATTDKRIRTRLDFEGLNDLFPASSRITDLADLGRHVARFPAFVQWAELRARHHRELRAFCGNDANRRALATRLVNFHTDDAHFEELRCGSVPCKNQYRHWCYDGGERDKELIAILALPFSQMELWEMNQKVLMAMPELCDLPSPHVTPSVDAKVHEHFACALAGDFEGHWPFDSLPPIPYKRSECGYR